MFVELFGDLFLNLRTIRILSETHLFNYLAVEVVSSWQEDAFLRSRHKTKIIEQ